MNHVIICVAMTAEFSPEDIKNNFSNLENINLHIVYTGIGKANAARALQEKISKLQEVDLVVNFGTAGGRNLSPGVYFGTELYEGDMKQEALGLPNGVNLNSNFEYKGENKKEAWTGQKIELSNPFKNIKSAKCVTRDAFVNDKPPIKEASHSLEEMEAHPLAVTCIQNNISFFPIKRVSNAIGGSTSSKEQGKEFSQDLLKHNQQNPFIAILKNDIIPLVKSGSLKNNLPNLKQDAKHSFSILNMNNQENPSSFSITNNANNEKGEWEGQSTEYVCCDVASL